MRTGNIEFGRSSYRRTPLIHLIEVDARDNPIGKTLCGRGVNRSRRYYVYEETYTKEPSCKKCIQKQRNEKKLTH